MAKILTLLSALEAELKQQRFWQSSRPSAKLLSSTQPFCIDTLRFEQWLQFVFIEKLQLLIANNQALPNQISLCPMAEEAFKSKGDAMAELINIIADIDETLSGKREQTIYVRK